MGCEEEVFKIGKKLEKMIATGTSDHAAAIDILKTLQDLPMTLDVLQKTRIGMVVNNFRKASTEDEVISLAKALIKSWKKLLPESGSQSGSVSRSNSVTKNEESSRDSTDNNSQESQKKMDKVDNTQHRQSAFPARPSDTTDAIRLKCRDLIANALKMDYPPEASQNREQLASAIEDGIFKEFRNTDMKYKNRVRSRVANLKDPKNPRLRENVLLGIIDPARIATMSTEEMASDDMKQLRAKLTKDAINDHQMAKTGGSVTDLIKCGRCNRHNCTYNQVQTRSADEPMTTFCLCNDCGNRWKFC